MIISLLVWLLLAGAATLGAQRLDFPVALGVWAALVALLCALGAWLIFRQPLGVADTGGLIGSSVVHWGFRAGRGQLLPAVAISWLIWLVLGSGLITALRFPEHAWIVAAWTANVLGLFYCVGAMLIDRGSGKTPRIFTIIALVITAVIGVSAVLWFRAGTDGARAIALTLAGGPPFLIGAGYGVVGALGFLAQPRGGR